MIKSHKIVHKTSVLNFINTGLGPMIIKEQKLSDPTASRLEPLRYFLIQLAENMG
jgi:hypothetical protein